MNYSQEAILFAEDLMKYIFEERGLNYAPRYKCETRKYQELISISPFRLIIGKAVCIGISGSLYELSLMFQQEFKSALDVPSFRRDVMKLLPDWFPEGYHPICFVEFCVMLCYTALSYHNDGYHEISSSAGEVISAVLTEQMTTGEFKQKGGWERLVKVSTELVILDKQKLIGHLK